MGNICCYRKKNLQTPLLKNTLYCVNCENNLPFNQYHKHSIECREKNINNKKYGEL